MVARNGFSQLAKVMFKDAENETELKHRLLADYPEEDLAGYLRSEDPLISRAAGFGLQLIGTDTVVPDLLEALQYEDPITCFNAEGALWEIWASSGDTVVDALMEDGRKLMEQEAYQEAVEQFTNVIETAPDFAEGYNQRAVAYFMLEAWHKSIRDCKQTLVHNPNHFGALAGMGHGYFRLGQIKEAADAYKEALDINPNMREISLALLRLRRQMEDR